MFILSGRMKIFASACVLISMIMLCTTWVKFSGTMAYDFSDYQKEVSGVLDTARWFLSWGDESIDMNSVEEAVNALLDGEIAPKRQFPLARDLIPLSRQQEIRMVKRLIYTHFFWYIEFSFGLQLFQGYCQQHLFIRIGFNVQRRHSLCAK